MAGSAFQALSLLARDRNDPTNSFSDIVLIDQTETTTDYFITVSVYPNAAWVVNYSYGTSASLIEYGEYLVQGFCNNGVMVKGRNVVDSPLTGSESHSNIGSV